MEIVISLKDVWFRYDSRQDWVLQKIHLTVHRGEWITILGTNGSGKSTLVRLMNGLLRPTSGVVSVYGKTTYDTQNLKDIRQAVGMVFQNVDNQIVGTTVHEDTAFGLHNIGVALEQTESRCRAVLQLLGLSVKKDHPPHLLSGGEKQKLAIAGILVMEPKIIIFDESASMLDPQSTKQIYELMSRLHHNGCTIVQVTHEVEEIFTADRLVVMRKGMIRFDGTPSEAAGHSDIFIDSGLLPPFSVRIRDFAARHGLHWLSAIETEWTN